MFATVIFGNILDADNPDEMLEDYREEYNIELDQIQDDKVLVKSDCANKIGEFLIDYGHETLTEISELSDEFIEFCKNKKWN